VRRQVKGRLGGFLYKRGWILEEDEASYSDSKERVLWEVVGTSYSGKLHAANSYLIRY